LSAEPSLSDTHSSSLGLATLLETQMGYDAEDEDGVAVQTAENTGDM
jgi:hypothetical protein